MGLTFSKIDWGEEPSVREKIYFVIVLVMILFAMMRLFWQPGAERIKKSKQEMRNISLQIDTLKKFIEIDKKIAERKPAVPQKMANEHIANALKKITDNPREVISGIIKEITSRKLMGNVTLNNLSFQTATARSGYTSVPVSLSAVGTFSSLQKYFSAMEKIDYLFTIDNVKLRLSTEHPGLIQADLDGSIYVGGSVEITDVKSEPKNEAK